MRFFVRGRLWRVQYGDASGDLLESKSEWGACIQSEQKIYLNPTLRLKKNEDRLWQTFVHEVVHAYQGRDSDDGHDPTGKFLNPEDAELHEQALGEFMHENYFFWIEQQLETRRDELKKTEGK